jgi:hypothetical protein
MVERKRLTHYPCFYFDNLRRKVNKKTEKSETEPYMVGPGDVSIFTHRGDHEVILISARLAAIFPDMCFCKFVLFCCW